MRRRAKNRALTLTNRGAHHLFNRTGDTTCTPQSNDDADSSPGSLCGQFAPMLPLLRVRWLNTDEEYYLREHLADCAWCRGLLAGYDVVTDALERYVTAYPSDWECRISEAAYAETGGIPYSVESPADALDPLSGATASEAVAPALDEKARSVEEGIADSDAICPTRRGPTKPRAAARGGAILPARAGETNTPTIGGPRPACNARALSVPGWTHQPNRPRCRRQAIQPKWGGLSPGVMSPSRPASITRRASSRRARRMSPCRAANRSVCGTCWPWPPPGWETPRSRLASSIRRWTVLADVL